MNQCDSSIHPFDSMSVTDTNFVSCDLYYIFTLYICYHVILAIVTTIVITTLMSMGICIIILAVDYSVSVLCCALFVCNDVFCWVLGNSDTTDSFSVVMK